MTSMPTLPSGSTNRHGCAFTSPPMPLVTVVEVGPAPSGIRWIRMRPKMLRDEVASRAAISIVPVGSVSASALVIGLAGVAAHPASGLNPPSVEKSLAPL